MKRNAFTILELFVALAIICAVLFVLANWSDRRDKRIICAVKLSILQDAIRDYGNDHNQQFPSADKWCDIILQGSDVNEGFRQPFICPAAGKGRSHYAINPKAEPNSPLDTVLLFEAKAGWNRFGGPELITTEYHQGKGCNVVFVGGAVQFIKKDQLDQLKWE